MDYYILDIFTILSRAFYVIIVKSLLDTFSCDYFEVEVILINYISKFNYYLIKGILYSFSK